MCLLVFAWQADPAYPLMVAANRDERLDRPAHCVCVLRHHSPRVLGGRDDLAGGTWLGVNEHGVVAGLTNRPSPGGRDPTKRSRGELPLIVTSQRSADDGVDELTRRIRPCEYNPAWLLIGDRESLYYVELAADRPPSVRQLSAGIHVLENVALGEPSLKVDRVRSLLSASQSTDRSLQTAMPAMLADHTVPFSADCTRADVEDIDAVLRRPATLASCVHADDYGTRSSALVFVPSDPLAMPDLLVADGPPCIRPFIDVGKSWVA